MISRQKDMILRRTNTHLSQARGVLAMGMASTDDPEMRMLYEALGRVMTRVSKIRNGTAPKYETSCCGKGQ